MRKFEPVLPLFVAFLAIAVYVLTFIEQPQRFQIVKIKAQVIAEGDTSWIIHATDSTYQIEKAEWLNVEKGDTLNFEKCRPLEKVKNSK